MVDIKRSAFILLFLSSLFINLLAQSIDSPAVDSLKQLRKHHKYKPEQIDLTLQIATAYQNTVNGTDSMFEYLNQVLNMAEEMISEEAKADTYLEIVKLTYAIQPNLADSLANIALSLTRNNERRAELMMYVDHFNRPYEIKEERTAVWDSIKYLLKDDLTNPLVVNYYIQVGRDLIDEYRLIEALDCFLKAEKIVEEDHPMLPSLLLLNGWVYNEMSVADSTLAKGLRAKDIANKRGDWMQEMYAIFAINGSAFRLGKYDIVKQASQRAFEIVEKYGSSYAFGEIYLMLARVALKEGKFEAAENYLLQGIALTERQGDAISRSYCYLGLSEVMLEKGEHSKAKEYAEKAMEYDSDVFLKRNLTIAKVYEKNNDYKTAYELATDFIDQKEKNDSINSPFEIISFLLTDRFEQQQLIEETRFENELKYQQSIGRRNLLIGLAVVIISFLTFLYFYNKRKNESINDVLQEQVKAQTSEILNQKNRLQILSREKAQLYTNITHEFRTPLTVILGMAKELENTLGSSTDNQRKVNLIQRNGKKLLNLINQVLDLSKAENSSLRLNNAHGNIISYIRYIGEEFSALAGLQNIQLTIESSEQEILMDYDEDKFYQIISNLLSNAIKYTPDGGQISLLTSRLSHNDQPFLNVQIKDNGSGIAQKDLPKVFNRFYQSDDDIAKTEGTGIGLALVQQLVILMNGTVRVESEPDKGATFVVNIPIQNKATRVEAKDYNSLKPKTLHYHSKEQTSEVANEPEVRLLIIEDNPDVLEYLASCLENKYQLDFASNGQIGIEKALSITPDIIISDVMMPKKNGFEVCDTLKNDKRSSHIPIVLLTARADMESRLAGLKTGADAYLAKPFNRQELEIILQNLLNSRKQLQLKYQKTIAEFPFSLPKTENIFENEFLTRVRQLLDENLSDNKLRSDKIYKKMGMSRSNFYAKLSAITGMSFNIYLRTLRLNKSKELLKNDNMNISEVAYEIGFNDPKYFSRVFSEQFGVSPSEFKNKL